MKIIGNIKETLEIIYYIAFILTVVGGSSAYIVKNMAPSYKNYIGMKKNDTERSIAVQLIAIISISSIVVYFISVIYIFIIQNKQILGIQMGTEAFIVITNAFYCVSYLYAARQKEKEIILMFKDKEEYKNIKNISKKRHKIKFTIVSIIVYILNSGVIVVEYSLKDSNLIETFNINIYFFASIFVLLLALFLTFIRISSCDEIIGDLKKKYIITTKDHKETGYILDEDDMNIYFKTMQWEILWIKKDDITRIKRVDE